MLLRRSALLALILTGLSLALAVPAVAKRPITFDDMIAMGRVSDPQVSQTLGQNHS